MASLLISLAVLAIVIAASSFRMQKQPDPDSAPEDAKLIQELMTVYFLDSSFPTVIFRPDLSIITANRSFTEVFQKAGTQQNASSMALIDRLYQNKACRELLSEIKETRKLPTMPVFVDVEFVDAGNESQTHIVLLRAYSDHPRIAPFMTMTAINSKYTQRIAEDLSKRLAEKDSNFKKLEEVDRLKSEFLATLSHELKTPLVSIKGYLDLIASEKMGPLTEKQAKAVQVSLKNTSHLNSMISSILNFARMEAGKLMFDLVHQKLPPRINDTVDSMRPIAENRNITLQTSYENDLPAVILDPELIHRVMCNLLENAIKFSPAGFSITVKVCRHTPQLVKVLVIDNGCGIPADKLELIKTPFYQIVKSDTRPTSGLGIGLAICEKILIGHGTSLTIESREGHGTSCSFCLKVASES